ncbi:MAG: glycoside hydrolase family 97 N-terminal domain-containing protein, partial [Phycisphaerales bacterium]
MGTDAKTYAVTALTAELCLSVLSLGQEQGQTRSRRQDRPRTRRTQRVISMQEVEVISPDGKVKSMLGSNPERLTWATTLDDTMVIEPSPLDMRMDGYDLSSGVMFNGLDVYRTNDTYLWHGANSVAVNRCNGAKVSLLHDLSQTP